MNYYFMMDDKAHKSFNFNVTYGRLDFEIQKKPLEEEWSRPFDYIYDRREIGRASCRERV